MSRVRIGVVSVAALLTTTVAASRIHSPRPPAVTREIIAVYLGTEGTDARSGMIEAVRDMRVALQRQAASSGRRVVMRGVSLEPSVADGVRHLSQFGTFDEVSLGGNWTNSAVVRYLGSDMGDHSRALIPQVVVLEREVREGGPESLVVGPERELARYIGTDQINAWVRRGTPLAP